MCNFSRSTKDSLKRVHSKFYNWGTLEIVSLYQAAAGTTSYFQGGACWEMIVKFDTMFYMYIKILTAPTCQHCNEIDR